VAPCSRIMPERRDQAVLTVLAGPQIGAVFRLEGERMLIGRDPDAELTLHDEGLSWHHARLHRVGQHLFLEDLDSTNGTFVGSERVTSPTVVNDGDRIGLGRRAVIKLELQDALEAAVAERLYESMVRDTLTGAYNRQAFDERLSAEMAFGRRHSSGVSVIMVDIDHFKNINDTHGHPAGDAVLKEVVAAMQQTIRTEDLLARYGGEEFALIARGITPDQALMFAERLRQTLTYMHIEHAGETIQVTASFGVATASASPLYDAPQLVAAADAALYEAKRTGRNRVVGWRPPGD
jgi:diguanylate cyclase (GGDEF)-like protein